MEENAAPMLALRLAVRLHAGPRQLGMERACVVGGEGNSREASDQPFVMPGLPGASRTITGASPKIATSGSSTICRSPTTSE